MKRLMPLIFFVTSTVLAQATISFKTGTTEEILASIETAVSKKNKNPAIVKSLIEALQSENSEIRVKERAAWALGQLRADSAVPSLMNASRDKGLLVRSAALNSLIHLRSSKALPVYVEIAKTDPILSLRQKATLALGLIRSDKSIEPLVKLSSDEREEIRGAAVLAMIALHSNKHNFSHVFEDLSADPSPYVQDRAKIALETIKSKNTKLASHLESTDPDIRLFIALSLRSKGHSTDLKSLKSALSLESDDDVKIELNGAINSIQKRAAKARAKKKKKSTTPAAASTSKDTK